jgi:hypothetical protein
MGVLCSRLTRVSTTPGLPRYPDQRETGNHKINMYSKKLMQYSSKQKTIRAYKIPQSLKKYVESFNLLYFPKYIRL